MFVRFSGDQRIIPSINLPESELEKYVGTYDWIERPGYHIEVIIRDGMLNFIAPGFPTDVLTPYDQHKFIDLESEVEVRFHVVDGQVQTVNWRKRFDYKKIE